MTTHFPLSGPMSVGDLLDRAFRLYRARFGVFLLTAAIFFFPAGIISAVVLMSGGDFSPPFLVLGAIISALGGQLLSITDYLIVLVLMIASGFVTLALTVQSTEMLHSRSLTVGQSIHRGTRRLWSHMGMTIATWAVLITVTAIAMLSIGVGLDTLDFLLDGLLYDLLDGRLDTVTTNPVSSLGLNLLQILAYVILVILLFAPPVYLFARWHVAPAALIAEGLGPIGSLRRSWQLSRGHTWRMIGYAILLFLIIRLFFFLPTILLEMIFAVLTPDSYQGLRTGVVTAVHSALSAVSVPIYIGAVVLLYYDLRIRKESYDLELRVADLEEQVAQGTVQDMP